MRESTIYNKLSGIVITLLLSGCGYAIPGENNSDPLTDEFQNSFTIEAQKLPPPDIRSVQLYRSGSTATPPLLRLGEDEHLVLEFDRIGSEARQFSISIRHYSDNWEPSSLAPEFYMGGFLTDYFGSGSISFSGQPSYRHYRYELPNPRISLTTSGNYLLLVHDPDRGELLFSVPFLVSEDEGTLQSRVEPVITARGERDQIFSKYVYPGFVEFPGFDLSYFYLQNYFWGRTQPVGQWDTSSPDAVYFHLARERLFPGDYLFRLLDLRSLSANGNPILAVEPEYTPPRVLLRRDLPNFPPASSQTGSRFGLPLDNRNARYTEVQFRLDAGLNMVDSSAQIHLVGDFNGWMPAPSNRMSYNPSSELWEVSSIVKQGEYAYKYITVENGRIDDRIFDQHISVSRQHYVTLVYFRDPDRHYDRLLKVEEFTY